MSRKVDKGLQCRYCTNSRDEGGGILMRWYPLWFCLPCFEKFKKSLREQRKEEKAKESGGKQ